MEARFERRRSVIETSTPDSAGKINKSRSPSGATPLKQIGVVVAEHWLEHLSHEGVLLSESTLQGKVPFFCCLESQFP
jgi:hypothetical protein